MQFSFPGAGRHGKGEHLQEIIIQITNCRNETDTDTDTDTNTPTDSGNLREW